MIWKIHKPALSAGFLFLVGSFLLTGCGSGDVASVSGTVKYDGQPLKGATIEFHPVEGGRYGTATTDDNGYYSLMYKANQYGTKVGKNKVKIYYSPREDENGNEIPPKIVIPPKYNSETTLIEEVPRGGKTINFDLQP